MHRSKRAKLSAKRYRVELLVHFTVFVSLVVGVNVAIAQELEEVGWEAEQQLESALFLEVFINNKPMNMITRFRDLGNLALSADAQELRNSGILPDSVARQGEVPLGQISGLHWEVNLQDQTIHFSAPSDLLAPHVVDVGQTSDTPAEEGEASPQIDHGYGLVLNYGLTLDSWRPDDGAVGHAFAGSFDTRLFMPIGALNHGFVFTEDQARDLRYRRLDTFWRSSFPSRAVQLQIGDMSTRGPSWARPVRLGGVAIERNFGIRPDLVTLPLPSFEGSAALPSTVEVFADSIRTYAVDVPAGPFRLESLPLVGRSGVAQVTVRDVTGRETRLDLPFLVSDDLLRPGMLDFGLSVGRPRLGIGTETDHYGEDMYGTATLRYGIADSLTLNAYTEAGEDFLLGGVGGTIRLGYRGTASLNIAQSKTASAQGQLIDFSTILNFGKAYLGAKLMQTEGTFLDIASLSVAPDLVEASMSGHPKRALSLNYTTPLTAGIGGNASLFLAQTDYLQGHKERSFGVFYSREIWSDSSLSLSAMAQRGQLKDTVIGANLHIPLGGRRSMSAAVDRSNDGMSHYISAAGRSDNTYPRRDWRLQASQANSRLALQGNVSREGQLGRIELGGRASQGGSGLGVRVDGSLVLAGGGIFLSRRIQDAFAVADVGAAGVEVQADNRPVGVTNRQGKILVAGLRAWEENTLTLDPANLPVDAAIDSTSQTVRPAYNSGTRVTFGVSASAQEAVVQLIDPLGAPLEVGGNVLVNGLDDEVLVGFDGEVYLLGLQARNSIEVSYPDGRRCSATFDYIDQPGTLSELRNVPCL